MQITAVVYILVLGICLGIVSMALFNTDIIQAQVDIKM